MRDVLTLSLSHSPRGEAAKREGLKGGAPQEIPEGSKGAGAPRGIWGAGASQGSQEIQHDILNMKNKAAAKSPGLGRKVCNKLVPTS